MVLLFICLFFSLICQSLAYEFPSIQFQSLESLYNSTAIIANGGWKWQEPYDEYGIPWNFTFPGYSNPCNGSYPWQGLGCNSTCEDSPCVVTSILLHNYFLHGTIPVDFYNITTLNQLQLSNNYLTGTLSPEIGQLTNITLLDYSYNFISGSIPNGIFHLSQLQYLTLSYTIIDGTLPEDIGNLSSIIELNFNNNNLQGTIPSSIGNLTTLKYLFFDSIDVSGTIPKELGRCTQLTEFFLSSGNLFGSLPNELGHLINLEFFLITSSGLTGTLPESLGNLISLNVMQIYATAINGTIPTSYGNLTQLKKLYLFQNQLTGTIPLSFAQLTIMEDLQLHSNSLIGTIPSILSNMSNLRNLYLYNNSLTGTIPPELFTLRTLTELFLLNNSFTGTIPSNLSNCTYLKYFFVNDNNLTGTIPNEFYDLEALNAVSLASNHFHGTISNKIGNYFYLQYFDVSRNMFTGILPDSFELNFILYFFNAANNQFTGTFPSNLLEVYSLQFLSLSNNYLTGTLPTVSQDSLQFLYISNNSFSGTIPSVIFEYPSLLSFVASLNCFQGTLPYSLCQSTKLSQLIIDGLHSSEKCYHHIFSWDTTSGYSLTNGIHGTIPSCIFELKTLRVLHMSGNNLHGKLDITGPRLNLTSLILSNNELTGTIPDQIWEGNIYYLDLSFNKLTNDIQEFNKRTKIFHYNITKFKKTYPLIPIDNTSFSYGYYLKDNRLSGNIPQGFLNTSTPLNILEGNMFACDFSKSNLPSQDPNSGSYQCGSDFTNISLFVWVGVLLAIVMLIWWIAGRNRIERSIKELSEMYNQFKQYYVEEEEIIDHNKVKDSPSPSNQLNPLSNSRLDIESLSSDSAASPPTITTLRPPKASITSLIDVNRAYYHFIRLLLNILLWTLLVILPCYVILTKYYGVYTHQYAWILSSAYLEDEVAAVVLLCLYSALMLIIAYPLLRVGREQVGVKFQFFWIPSIEDFPWLKQWYLGDSNEKDKNKTSEINEDVDDEEKNTGIKEYLFLKYLKISLFILFDVVIVLLVNIGYVSAINGGFTNTQLSFIFLSITLFKLLWSNVFLLGSGRLLAESLLGVKIQAMTIVLTSIFNNVIAPYVAEGFVSPNCFLYAITLPPSIESTYFDFKCFPLTQCIDAQCFTSINCPFLPELFFPEFRSTLTYYPPFHYTFTCSSSLISSFGYVFIYRYLITGLFEPIFYILLKYIQLNHDKFAKYLDDNLLFRLVTMILPVLLKYENSFDLRHLPLPTVHIAKEKRLFEKSDDDNKNTNEVELSSMPIEKTLAETKAETAFDTDINGQKHYNTSNDSTSFSNILYTLEMMEYSIENGVNIGEKVIVRLITDVALLLSFGVMFPPLAIIICFSIIKDMMIVQMSIGRLLYDASNPSQPFSLFGAMKESYFDRSYMQSTETFNELKQSIDHHNIPSAFLSPASSVSIGSKNSIASTTSTMIIWKLHRIVALLNHQFKPFHRRLWQGIWWSSLVSVCFWSFTLFDTLGGTVGPLRAVWIIVAIVMSPFWTLGLLKISRGSVYKMSKQCWEKCFEKKKTLRPQDGEQNLAEDEDLGSERGTEMTIKASFDHQSITIQNNPLHTQAS